MNRNPHSDFWLNCARAGMELCWLAAWINYISLTLFSANYPWHNALAAFFGACLAHWLGRRGRRRIYQVALIHLVLLTLAVLWGLHSFYGQGADLWDPAWMQNMAPGNMSANEVLYLMARLTFSLLFWYSGRRFFLRGRDYESTARSFDRGVAALLGLFAFKLFLRVHFQEIFPDPVGPALLVGFFCFALPALAWSRSRNPSDLTGLIGGGLWQSSLGLLITIVLLAGGAASLYLPYFNQAAHTGYVVLQKTLSPLLPYLVAILRFIFGARSVDQPRASSSRDKGDIKPGEGDLETPLWLEIILYVVIGLVLLAMAGILLVLIVITVRHFIRWLGSSTGQRLDQPSLWRELCDFLGRICQWTLRNIMRFDPTLPAALAGYRRLKKWGRRSGLALRTGETPREYSGRLTRDFPGLAGEVGAIVEAHEQVIYAQKTVLAFDAASLRHRFRRMASPVWWPRRLKNRWRGSR